MRSAVDPQVTWLESEPRLTANQTPVDRSGHTAEVRRFELSSDERQVVLARDASEWVRDVGLFLVCGVTGALSLVFAWHADWIGMVATILMAVALAAGLVHWGLTRRRQAERSEKEVIRGRVLRKRRGRHRRPIFHVFVGDIETRVDHTLWHRLRLGDHVELHRATLGGRVFAIYRRPAPPVA